MDIIPIIFVVILIILILISLGLYSTAVAVGVAAAIVLSNKALTKKCVDTFISAASGLGLDGKRTWFNNADVGHQSVADLGDEYINTLDGVDMSEGFMTPHTRLLNGGSLEDDLMGMNGGGFSEDASTLNAETVDEDADINNMEYPHGDGVAPMMEPSEFALYNTNDHFDGGNTKKTKLRTHFEEPIVQELPTMINNKWLMNSERAVKYDTGYVESYLVDETSNTEGDRWLRQRMFRSQLAQDNEYYNNLSKVELFRDDYREMMLSGSGANSNPLGIEYDAY